MGLLTLSLSLHHLLVHRVHGRLYLKYVLIIHGVVSHVHYFLSKYRSLEPVKRWFVLQSLLFHRPGLLVVGVGHLSLAQARWKHFRLLPGVLACLDGFVGSILVTE